MTLSLSLATFFRPNSSFAFDSLQHHVHIRHRRDYDEEQAGVVVKASSPGQPIKQEIHKYANVANGPQRLRQPLFKCGLQSRATKNPVNTVSTFSTSGKSKRTLRISENINFTNDDVMNYVIRDLQ